MVTYRGSGFEPQEVPHTDGNDEASVQGGEEEVAALEDGRGLPLPRRSGRAVRPGPESGSRQSVHEVRHPRACFPDPGHDPESMIP
ncbi:hypothetical protein APS67_006489 [Streptomyces sp. AVP053U2]|nr:hypothetical protein APS67_006489 [Streptomyces sp. AVP053U2]